MSVIHPTAIIERGAELGTNVRVGAHCYIGPDVKLGEHCELRHGASVVGRTMVGEGCVFFSHCVVGETPQDLKYRGEPTETHIGNDNHFREFVTVHAGTELGGGVTSVGNHNRFLVGVHIAHDVCVGDNVVISNGVQIAGHVHIEDCVTMGGQSGIHHFTTVGRYAMLGGLSRVTVDVPPYMITSGYPAEVRGLNYPGLNRWQMQDEDIESLSRVYKVLYGKRSDTSQPFAQRLSDIEEQGERSEHVQYLCNFIRRSLSAGNCGRFRESLRTDRPEDNRTFSNKKLIVRPTPRAEYSKWRLFDGSEI